MVGLGPLAVSSSMSRPGNVPLPPPMPGSCSLGVNQFFPAEQGEITPHGFVSFFLGIQCGQPLASCRTRGVDFEKLGIDAARARTASCIVSSSSAN